LASHSAVDDAVIIDVHRPAMIELAEVEAEDAAAEGDVGIDQAVVLDVGATVKVSVSS
jgi:hypothetical protein